MGKAKPFKRTRRVKRERRQHADPSTTRSGGEPNRVATASPIIKYATDAIRPITKDATEEIRATSIPFRMQETSLLEPKELPPLTREKPKTRLQRFINWFLK